jgi:hypothetical protein
MSQKASIESQAASAEAPRDFLPIFEWTKWFHPKQQMFVNSVKDNYETMFVGGNGSGKSRILYWSIVTLLIGIHKYQPAAPPIHIKVLVNDFEHGLDRVAYDTMFSSCAMPDGSLIGPMMPQSMIESMWQKERRILKLTNGSMASFMTSVQPRRLHSGDNFDILVCDEEPRKPAYDESKRGLRNAKGGGKILHGMTPPYEEGRGPSWTKFDIIDPFDAGELPRTGVIHACMADNPAVTPQFIEEFKRGKTEEQWRVQFYGDYPTFGKMCHPDFQNEIWDPAAKRGNLLDSQWEVPWEDDRAVYEMSVDWHQSKPAAAVWTCTDAEGNVVVYDELSPEAGRDKTIWELAEIFREIEGHRFGPRNPYHIRRIGEPKMKDKSHAVIRGFSAWAEFRNCGINFSEGYSRQPDVGISIVNDFIRGNTVTHPRLFVCEHCVNTIKGLRNHYWVKKDESDPGEPDKRYSDYPICVRWLLQPKARRAKQGIKAGGKRPWPITSCGGRTPDYSSHWRGTAQK